MPAIDKPSEYDAAVPAEKMPPCPICGRPLRMPPVSDADRLLVFIAHGMAALAHDGCRVEGKPGT
jgi:hypothetical protein